MSFARVLCISLAASLLASCGDSPRAAAPSVAPFVLAANAIEAKSADGTYIARWEPEGGAIPDADPFTMRLGLRRADGKAIKPDARIAVDAEMPQHGHGMNLVPVVERVWSATGTAGAAGEELLVAKGMLLHMTGRWVLSLDVGEDGIIERTQWYIDVK